MINATKFPSELSYHDNFSALSSHRKLTDDRRLVHDYIMYVCILCMLIFSVGEVCLLYF